jgi:predicted transglutaminase-like cysteine proteinase
MTIRQALFAIVFALVSIDQAQATSLDDEHGLPSTSAIAEGSDTLAPLPFVRFCMSNPDDCKPSGSGGAIALDSRKLRTLTNVNTNVNARIYPEIDVEERDDWSLTTANGDCNDYAIQKRHELLATGWPTSALSLAVVTTASGKGHLVLTVRTDRGDLVLDNLRGSVFPWKDADYRWVKRQSAEEPRRWVTIKGATAPRQRIKLRS